MLVHNNSLSTEIVPARREGGCARVAVLVATNRLTAEQQLALLPDIADIIELRLDYWSALCLEEIAQLRNQFTLPVIFTLRKISQGGNCHWSEPERLDFIKKLAGLGPEYFDLEYDVPVPWLQNFRREFPHITLIGSYHDFTHTPENLMENFQALLKTEFDIIKLAYMAKELSDTLRLLIFINSLSQRHAVIGIAMGEAGQLSRIVAPVVGSIMTYGVIHENLSSAPGQISLQDLTQIYRVQRLNRHSRIYALLGDPVAQSPGHRVHNHAFEILEKNAVYVKCRIPAAELGPCLTLMQKLPFYGMSVTIPHKETIVPFLDKLDGIAAQMKIVNTLNCENQLYCGHNTDALAAIEILEKRKSLLNESILILGAGGSAKAIAFALQKAGAKITLCNRTLARAQHFTEQHGGVAIDFETLFSEKTFTYSVVINTLPGEAYAQQCAEWRLPLSPPGIAMDIVLKPLETLFLKSARKSGWSCVRGDRFYRAQAIGQLKIWFDLDEEVVTRVDALIKHNPGSDIL